MKLTETQRWTAINGLRVAAERFADNAKAFDGDQRHQRLAAQFRRQQAESLELADYMEEADD